MELQETFITISLRDLFDCVWQDTRAWKDSELWRIKCKYDGSAEAKRFPYEIGKEIEKMLKESTMLVYIQHDRAADLSIIWRWEAWRDSVQNALANNQIENEIRVQNIARDEKEARLIKIAKRLQPTMESLKFLQVLDYVKSLTSTNQTEEAFKNALEVHEKDWNIGIYIPPSEDELKLKTIPNHERVQYISTRVPTEQSKKTEIEIVVEGADVIKSDPYVEGHQGGEGEDSRDSSEERDGA